MNRVRDRKEGASGRALATRPSGSGAITSTSSRPGDKYAVAFSENDDELALVEEGEPPEPKKRILVVGGTGLQGGAVVRKLLELNTSNSKSKGKFIVSVMTRTPDSEAAMALREVRAASHLSDGCRVQTELARVTRQMGVTIVKGDMDDPLGLDRAFGIASGATPGVHPTPGALSGVFGVSNYWLPTPSGQREMRHMRYLIDAAKRARVGHFIYSSIASCACEDGPFHGFEQGTGKHTSTLLGVRPRIRGGTEAMAGARRRRGGLSRPRAGIPHFESKREVEAHLKKSGVRFTIIRPSFLMDNFWHPSSPWAHPGTNVAMPFQPETVQQMVWSMDVGAMVAKAFDQEEEWIGAEVELAGDALTGPEIAAVFSAVTMRPMEYHQGPPPLLLRCCFSNAGWMQTHYFDTVGGKASIGGCRKLLPSLHTLEQTLLLNDWAGRPSDEFRQGACSCTTCDTWVYTLACPCCIAGYVAHDANSSVPLCCLATLCPWPLAPCAHAVVRGQLRQKYKLRGSGLLDCCCHFCCPLCALVQEAAEVRAARRDKVVPRPEDPDMAREELALVTVGAGRVGFGPQCGDLLVA
jgi:Cys-rich protein (TIGR01571 family)